MDKQDALEGESTKGVRRPRSDAGRRPRPQSRCLASFPGHDSSTSHPFRESFREVQNGQFSNAHDQSSEARQRDGGAEVMGTGVVVLENRGDAKEIKFYSRTGGKDQRRKDAMDGRDEQRVGRDDGRFSSRRDLYARVNEREESRPYRMLHLKEDVRYDDRGEERESNGKYGGSKPSERTKRPEKSMKEIVERERDLKDIRSRYKGGSENSLEKDKVGRREKDEEGGKERGARDRVQTLQTGRREEHGGGDTTGKYMESWLPEQKSSVPTKLKLKVGGVTHTLVSDSAKRKPLTSSLGASETKAPAKVPEPDDGGRSKKRRHRLILQDISDDEEEHAVPQVAFPPPKAPKRDMNNFHSPTFRGRFVSKEGRGDYGQPSGSLVEQPKAKLYSQPKTTADPTLLTVRKSTRVPKKRVLDGDEEEVLEETNVLSRQLSHGRGGRRVEEETEVPVPVPVTGAVTVPVTVPMQEVEDSEEDEELSAMAVGATSDEDEDLEDLDDEDEEEGGPGRVKRGRVQNIGNNKEKSGNGVALTARQRAMQSSKEGDGDVVTSLIEFPEGLTNPSGRKGKGKLTDAERQVKRAEAARRRKQQVEKAAKEIQATAIQKILGQDSTRKRREDRLQKQRQEIEQEKKAAALEPATNTIRWSLGPLGTVVSFADDVGLPNFFKSGPGSYPPVREKCAAPSCPNTYKYRDSKSHAPLCSLQCYRVVHQTPAIASA